MLVFLSLYVFMCFCCRDFFFFNDTATTEIYTLSLHDALPIYQAADDGIADAPDAARGRGREHEQIGAERDRKSTRLNSSHTVISYAVFCLKKKRESNDPHGEFYVGNSDRRH